MLALTYDSRHVGPGRIGVQVNPPLTLRTQSVGIVNDRRPPVSKPRIVSGKVLVIMPIIAGAMGSVTGCESSRSQRRDWTNVTDSVEVRIVVESPTICAACIVLERVAVLGDTKGPGFVEWTQYVTRDSLGNYWVGQNGPAKLFDSTGAFVREVGRPGGGPMEFGSSSPVYSDANSRVHILDPINLRATVVGPNDELYAESRLPRYFNTAIAVSDGAAYLLNVFMPTSEAIGFPLHIVEGSEIRHSFGVAPSEKTPPLNPFNSRRVLAGDASNHVFSAPFYEYFVEVWTTNGRRVTGFKGPTLNDKPPVPGSSTLENPPPNQLWAIRVTTDSLLWIVTSWLKPDWRDRVEEIVRPNGSVGIRAFDDDPRFLFTSRIEVINLNSASIVARDNGEELITAFVGDGLGLETRYLDDGTPQLNIWRMTLVNH